MYVCMCFSSRPLQIAVSQVLTVLEKDVCDRNDLVIVNTSVEDILQMRVMGDAGTRCCVYACVCTNVRMYVCMYVCMSVCFSVSECACMYVGMSVCMCLTFIL